MQSNSRQACSPAQNRGAQGVLCRGFQGYQEVVPTGQGRVLLATCAEADACLPQLRPGGAGTARLTSTRRGQFTSGSELTAQASAKCLLESLKEELHSCSILEHKQPGLIFMIVAAVVPVSASFGNC